MSQTDTVTYLSADDLLGKTNRTKLIKVEVPELADDEGNPGVAYLLPPPASVTTKFMTSSENRKAINRMQAANSDADFEELETDANFLLLAGMVKDLAVHPDRTRLFPKDLSVNELLEGMSVRVLNRMVTGLSEAMSAQVEEGEAKAKKSKKTRRTASATKSPGGAESKSGS